MMLPCKFEVALDIVDQVALELVGQVALELVQVGVAEVVDLVVAFFSFVVLMEVEEINEKTVEVSAGDKYSFRCFVHSTSLLKWKKKRLKLRLKILLQRINLPKMGKSHGIFI